MDIKFLSSVVLVKDIQLSKRFYEETLLQKVEMDFGPNVGFEGGLSIWEAEHANQILFGKPYSGEKLGHDNLELYFETNQLDEVCAKIEKTDIEVIHPMREMPWGQRVIRFYDPDRHIIEVGEPMSAVIARCLGNGMSIEETAKRTSMPPEIVKQVAAAVQAKG